MCVTGKREDEGKVTREAGVGGWVMGVGIHVDFTEDKRCATGEAETVTATPTMHKNWALNLTHTSIF